MIDLPTEAEPVRIIQGDCLEVMRSMPDGCVDAVVTDPPYGLVEPRSQVACCGGGARKKRTEEEKAARRGGYMGKKWDAEVPGVEVWSASLRVLKPGGYACIFGGTRTYHRLACAVEDAGFEIRDSILFMHSKPFDLLCNCPMNAAGSALPYIHDIRSQEMPEVRANMDAENAIPSIAESVLLDDLFQGVPAIRKNESQAGNHVYGVRQDVPSPAESCGTNEIADMLVPVQRKATRRSVGKARPQRAGGVDGDKQSVIHSQDDGAEQPGVERRRDLSEAPRELRSSEVCAVPGGPVANGKTGRVCDGASIDNGSLGGQVSHANGDGTSHRPQPAEQLTAQPRTVAGQPHSQTRGVGTICERCGKPTVMPPGWEGIFSPYLYWQYGSGFPKGKGCLKPAYEPILLCRKPGPKVLPLGIDECRVPTDENLNGGAYAKDGADRDSYEDWRFKRKGDAGEFVQPAGRWPANIVHDGSEEVLEAFAAFGELDSGGPSRRHSGHYTRPGDGGGYCGFRTDEGPQVSYADHGTAARFFYCAKASRKERGEGNNHPTVKPLALMRWLVRMVAKPGEVIIDPFAGSGTTGKAADAESRRCILIEKEPAYVEIARRRVKEAMGTGLLALASA